MNPQDVSEEVVSDLLRSCWIVEGARTETYDLWSAADPAYEASAARARARQAVFSRTLAERGVPTDPDLVAPHGAWMQSLVGGRGDEVPLANLFLARLGDWIEGHASMFIGSGATELASLGDEERGGLVWPSELPAPPAFERIDPPGKPAPERGDVRVAVVADLHIGVPGAERAASALVEDVNAAKPDLVIQLGDLTDHGNKEEFTAAAAIVATFEAPVTTMMGNHDVFSIGEERLAGREYYPASFGREPDGVLLEESGFRFAVLDSVEHAASPFAPFNLVAGSFVEGPGGAIARGSLTPPQHDILADIASPGAPPAFVFLHHPVQPFTGFPPVLFGLREADSGRLHAAVDSGNVWGVFAGHTHRNARTRNYGAVPAQEIAVPHEFPCGYALLDIFESGYNYRFLQLSDDDVLRASYDAASLIHRRYSLGPPETRSFEWRRPQNPADRP